MSGYVNSSKHRILTREEEVVLGRTVVAGQKAAKQLNEAHIEGIKLDYSERRALNAAVEAAKDAKNTFVEHNLRLAMDTAARYSRSQSRIEYEDWIRENTKEEIKVQGRVDNIKKAVTMEETSEQLTQKSKDLFDELFGDKS